MDMHVQRSGAQGPDGQKVALKVVGGWVVNNPGDGWTTDDGWYEPMDD